MTFEIADLQRINLIGTSASGKSTLGRKLSDLLDSPYVEMDTLFHGPNWSQAPPEVFRARVADAVNAPRWVLDGNYHKPNMYRAVGRAVRRSWTQTELWPGTGNRESFRQNFFSRDSMILWTATSHKQRRRLYSQIEQSPPDGVKFICLPNFRSIEQFLETVRATIDT